MKWMRWTKSAIVQSIWCVCVLNVLSLLYLFILRIPNRVYFALVLISSRSNSYSPNQQYSNPIHFNFCANFSIFSIFSATTISKLMWTIITYINTNTTIYAFRYIVYLRIELFVCSAINSNVTRCLTVVQCSWMAWNGIEWGNNNQKHFLN